jgi:hypothetical protein
MAKRKLGGGSTAATAMRLLLLRSLAELHGSDPGRYFSFDDILEGGDPNDARAAIRGLYRARLVKANAGGYALTAYGERILRRESFRSPPDGAGRKAPTHSPCDAV